MPGKARGTHVPGAPLKGLPSARAPGLPRGFHQAAEGRRPRSGFQAPGSGIRFFVPAHARPILTDGVRGSPAANGRALLASPAPSNPGPRPSGCPRGLGLRRSPALPVQYPGRLPLHLRVCAAELWLLVVASFSIVAGPSGNQNVLGRRRCCPPYQQGGARGSIRQGNGRGFRARRSHRNPVRYRRYHNPDCFREGEGRKGAGKLLVPKST